MKFSRLLLLICLLICCDCPTVFACRYNVRETGFIDFGNRPYRFYGYISEDTPEDFSSSFAQVLSENLADCNVQFEIVNVDQQNDHPSLEYLRQCKVESYPAAILVAPDGRSLVVPIEKKAESFKKTLRSAIDEIVSSSKREEIIQKVQETYGVILLIEGGNSRENRHYQNIALKAIDRIKGQMKFMPKHIAHPPTLISLEHGSIEEEKILLWSLGLNTDDLDEPHAAVFYGKTRWIGPLMKAEEITEYNLTGILSVIGADCECGLDVSWLRGTMLPIRWDQKIQAEVSKSLKFDPENPMVKMEVSRIMKRGSSSYPGVPPDYQDLSRNSESLSMPFIVDEEKTNLNVLTYFAGGFVILILITSLFILIRARRRTN